MDEDPGTTAIYFRVPPATKRRFRDAADGRGITMNDLFIELVEQNTTEDPAAQVTG